MCTLGLSASVQFSCLVVSDSLRPRDCSMPGFPVYHQLPELAQAHVHWVGDAIQPSHPLSSASPPAFNLPSIRIFSSESVLWIRWAGVSASASVLPVNIQYWSPLGWTGCIPLQSKGLSRVFPQYHSSKASTLWPSAFFMFQLSHPYMTAGKTTDLTRWTFVSKVMSLLFNTLSRLVITFLPRSKRLLISGCSHHLQWFLEPPKIKSDTVSTVSPSICHEVMGPDAIISITCIKSNSAWGALTPLALWQGSRLYREGFHFLCVVSTSHNDVLSGKN